MSTYTPIPSSNGEFRQGSLEGQAKEIRVHTAMRGLYGLYTSLVPSFGYDVVAEDAPAPARTPATPVEVPRQVLTAPKAVTPVSVEIAAGERSMLDDDPENKQNIDSILRMIDELHEEGRN